MNNTDSIYLFVIIISLFGLILLQESRIKKLEVSLIEITQKK